MRPSGCDGSTRDRRNRRHSENSVSESVHVLLLHVVSEPPGTGHHTRFTIETQRYRSVIIGIGIGREMLEIPFN
jgi:hypothetical protein